MLITSKPNGYIIITYFQLSKLNEYYSEILDYYIVYYVLYRYTYI